VGSAHGLRTCSQSPRGHRHGLHRHAAAALFAFGVLPGGVAAAGGVALEQIAREPRLDGNGRGALAVAVQLAAGD